MRARTPSAYIPSMSGASNSAPLTKGSAYTCAATVNVTLTADGEVEVLTIATKRANSGKTRGQANHILLPPPSRTDFVIAPSIIFKHSDPVDIDDEAPMRSILFDTRLILGIGAAGMRAFIVLQVRAGQKLLGMSNRGKCKPANEREQNKLWFEH